MTQVPDELEELEVLGPSVTVARDPQIAGNVRQKSSLTRAHMASTS